MLVVEEGAVLVLLPRYLAALYESVNFAGFLDRHGPSEIFAPVSIDLCLRGLVVGDAKLIDEFANTLELVLGNGFFLNLQLRI